MSLSRSAATEEAPKDGAKAAAAKGGPGGAPGKSRPALTWDEATRIDWGVVLLFGGGILLGDLARSTGLTDTLYTLMAARAFAGLFGGSIATAQAYVADVTLPTERTKYMGLVGASIGMGFVFGPFVGAELSRWGFATAAFVAAALSAANLLLALFALRESLPPSARGKSQRVPLSIASLHGALSRPVVGPLLLITMLSTLAFVAMESTFALFAKLRYGFSEQTMGRLFALIGILAAPVLWTQMEDYQKSRITTFINPEGDPTAFYNINQALISIGSGGFVGKEPARPSQENPCQGQALLLAARQVLGIMREPAAQADALQPLGGDRARVVHAGELQRQHHVLQRGERRQQLEGLEHEADRLAAQRRATRLAGLRDGEHPRPAEREGHVEQLANRRLLLRDPVAVVAVHVVVLLRIQVARKLRVVVEELLDRHVREFRRRRTVDGRGVGGRAGHVVGEKLWGISDRHQVICITHLPQVASFGDSHYAIAKSFDAERTRTLVQRLSDEQRADELAAMLDGVPISDHSRRSAQEMLERAAGFKTQAQRDAEPVATAN